MVQAAAAIGDFMLILAGQALWVGGRIFGAGLLGVGAIGGAYVAARRWRRPR